MNTLSPTTEEQRNLEAVTAVLPAWNAHDVDAVLRHYDPQIVWRNIPLEETYRGHAEVGAFLQSLFTAFPDLSFEVLQRIAEGPRIAETWVIQGTHRGNFLGIPPTGKPVRIDGMSFVQMRDGRFLQDDFQFDAAGVLRQLGLLPSMAASLSRPGRAVLWMAVRRRTVLGSALGVAALAGLSRALRRGR